MADESKTTALPTSPPPEYTETATSPLAPHPPPPTVEDEPTHPEESTIASKPPLPPRTATQASTSASSPVPPRSGTRTSTSDHMPRKPVPASSSTGPGPAKPQESLFQQAKGALPTSFAGAKDSAMKYGKFVFEHVKKGEMPWTQWYCSGLVNGVECETENHRLYKECKKCGHRVCEKCVKGTLGG